MAAGYGNTLTTFTRQQVRAKRFVVRLMVAIAPLRRILNQHYLALGDDERFHDLYDSLFRRGRFHSLMRDPLAQWTSRFMNRNIVMPLDRKSLWLHWDLAISINTVDIEVKQTYSELLSSEMPPELFFDVGANYGTHSILFRSAEIPVVAFEPNPTCFEYCKTVCQLNGFSVPQWEQVAIGDKTGQVTLVYPDGYAWLGSISPAVIQSVADSNRGSPKVDHVVPLRPLDDYIDQTIGKRLLIKLDVEGLELEVLRGASRILTEVRPSVIFESNDAGTRVKIYELFTSHYYSIFALPWRNSDAHMTPEFFSKSKATNFFARPAK